MTTCAYQIGTIECRGDGFLWDADDDGFDPADESAPCPRCNTRQFLLNQADDARVGGGQSCNGFSASSAEIWILARNRALAENQSEAMLAINEIGDVESDDWGDLEKLYFDKMVPVVILTTGEIVQLKDRS